MKKSSPLRLGLKLWSKNRNYLDEAKRLASEIVCDYIELYAFPGTFEEFAPIWKAIDIPYVIHAAHFMQGMNLADPNCRDSNRKLADEAFAFADYLGADNVIFHPGAAGGDEETIRQLAAWPEDRRNRILIENKPYRSIHEVPLICNGHSPEAIRRIMDATGVGFCYDIGHGICSSNSRKTAPWSDLAAYERLGPDMHHLSDNDFPSEIDGHMNLGHGNYDFRRILENIDVSKPISLETEKSGTTLADFESDVEFLMGIFS